MKTLRRDILIELFWLMGILILSVVGKVILSLVIGNEALDINLHDTYFVVDKINYFFTDLVFISFVVYVIRAIFTVYRAKNINILLILFNLFLIFFLIPLAFQVLAFIKPSYNGWTIYPPLSALPKAQPVLFDYRLLVFKLFIVCEIILIIHLCFISM